MDQSASDPTPATAQYRAARAMLGWSLTEASRRAGVSVATIAAIEKGRSPPSVDHGGLLLAAYATGGIDFFSQGACRGLRLRSRALHPSSSPASDDL